jgi:endoglucanase
MGAAPAVPLHTTGPYIVDSNGYRVRLNAVNWYGAEGTDYVVMGLESEPLATIVSEIKARGFNAVRLPWSNEMYESNPLVGDYALTANTGYEGDHALTIFDAVVNALTSAGIMVILDNHVSTAAWCCSSSDVNALWYNSAYPWANYVSDWEGIVNRYKSNTMVIGVDLRNEPRGSAVWGGGSSEDWHQAATLVGNDIQGQNSNLLIFVEGINFAGNLSGVSGTPVTLNTANKVVYEAHDYGYWYSGLSGYSNWYNDIYSNWGYLVTGSNPQPLWIGEFGTCNTASTCVSSTSNSQNGYWFGFEHQFLWEYSVDWSYWALDGTTESDNTGFGTVETYGILNTSWGGDALSALTSNLESLETSGGGPATGIYKITNVNSSLVMEVSGASKASGAEVDQYTWNGGTNQEWTLAYLSNGLYSLTNVNSGMVLDVSGASKSMGGDLIQYTSNSGSNQEFIISQTADGNYKIVNSNSGYAVEVPGSSKSTGVQLDQWGLNGGTNQEWVFTSE